MEARDSICEVGLPGADPFTPGVTRVLPFRFLPFPKLRWKALDEIDAGICDGMTYEQIAEKYPQEYEARKKDKLRYRCEPVSTPRWRS
jgi:hypothetical protein